MLFLRCLLLLGFLLQTIPASAQIPVELFGGDKRMTFDLMFFRFFKKKEGQNSPFLFFSRERAAVDYRQTTTAFLPQFGFTEAISWNPAWLKGFAPVLVGQILNRGTVGKAGIQYARIKPSLTMFGWVVSELNEKPNCDLFWLIRFTPKLSASLDFFAQAEFLNEIPMVPDRTFGFTQRARIGIQHKSWQVGFGIDLSQRGLTTFTTTENSGAFLRHEF